MEEDEGNERFKEMDAGKRHYERESFIKEMGQAWENRKEKSGE
ncbi:hypothetical protein ABID99_005700 [Mucilaginibacter sp. OAE612]